LRNTDAVFIGAPLLLSGGIATAAPEYDRDTSWGGGTDVNSHCFNSHHELLAKLSTVPDVSTPAKDLRR